VKHNV
jgi:hypothetical protein